MTGEDKPVFDNSPSVIPYDPFIRITELQDAESEDVRVFDLSNPDRLAELKSDAFDNSVWHARFESSPGYRVYAQNEFYAREIGELLDQAAAEGLSVDSSTLKYIDTGEIPDALIVKVRCSRLAMLPIFRSLAAND